MEQNPAVAPDHPYLRLLEGVEFQPVFIMGDHRSGTTLLYQLLNSTGCFNVVTAYHIIKYDEILANHARGGEQAAKEALGREFAELGLAQRAMDGVEVSPDLPEEYGFRLRDAGPRPFLRPANAASLIELCKKVQRVSNPALPLLLKNPWDFANFMHVNANFPGARFVFLHRDPLHVINSQVKATRALFGDYSVYHGMLDGWYRQLFDQPLRLAVTRWLFSGGFGMASRIATRHVARATRYFLRHVDELAAADYINITYDEVCVHPKASLDAILGFLGLQCEADTAIADMIEPRPIQLEPEIERHRARIRQRLQAYIDYFGFRE